MHQRQGAATRGSREGRSDNFVAAPFVRLLYRAGYVEALPVGVAHAKTYGTTHTVCGLDASSWHRLWDRSFPADAGDCCPRCVQRLDEGSAGASRRSGAAR